MHDFAMSRRRLLSASLAAGAGLMLGPGPAAAQQSLQWLPLETDLALVSGAGGNVLAARSGDKVMLVDGGGPGKSDTLLALVRDRFGAEPALLFNTHWHQGQTGANRLLGARGADIVAHENTRLWLGTEVISDWEGGRRYAPLPEEARPNRTFYYDSHRLDLAGLEAEYGFLPQAHTDGDIYVFLPRWNVMAAGDVVAGEGYPLLDYITGGWIGGMLEALDLLLARSNEGTRFIAGTGGIVGRERLRAQRDLCKDLVGRMADSYYKGETREEFLAGAPTRDYDARWGDPTLFLHTAYEGVRFHLGDARRLAR